MQEGSEACSYSSALLQGHCVAGKAAQTYDLARSGKQVKGVLIAFV